MEIESLATEWIFAIRNKVDSERVSKAESAVLELELDDPETLWLLILEILSRKNVTDVLETLGAGPLEELIALNGGEYFERIHQESQKNEKFAEALKSVWVDEEVKPSVEAFTEIGCIFVSSKAT